MSSNRSRIDAATADRLLSGHPAGPEYHRLAAVLDAAASPGRPTELSGRSAALAEFRAVALRPAAPYRRPSVIKTMLVKLLTVKALAVSAAVLGTGGLALAASTGTLPTPLTTHSTSHGPDSAEARAGARAQTQPSRHPSKSPNDPNGSPSPSMAGLCHAYAAKTAEGGADHGKALDSPAFRALVTTAGGKEKVTDFCTTLLAASSSSGPSNGSTATDVPPGQAKHSGTPSERSKEHPTGQPSKSPR